jgi:hypothetical protein
MGQSNVNLLSLDPQPLPPGETLDFVAVATWPAD